MVWNISWFGRSDSRSLALSVLLFFFLSSSSFFRPKKIEKHLSMLGFERIDSTDNILVGSHTIGRVQYLP